VTKGLPIEPRCLISQSVLSALSDPTAMPPDRLPARITTVSISPTPPPPLAQELCTPTPPDELPNRRFAGDRPGPRRPPGDCLARRPRRDSPSPTGRSRT